MREVRPMALKLIATLPLHYELDLQVPPKGAFSLLYQRHSNAKDVRGLQHSLHTPHYRYVYDRRSLQYFVAGCGHGQSGIAPMSWMAPLFLTFSTRCHPCPMLPSRVAMLPITQEEYRNSSSSLAPLVIPATETELCNNPARYVPYVSTYLGR